MASKEQLYEASMAKWGIRSQLDMLAEECCELSIAALKQHRSVNGAGPDKLAEELADVEIMSEQFIHCCNLREKVDDWKEKKLRRLANTLEE